MPRVERFLMWWRKRPRWICLSYRDRVVLTYGGYKSDELQDKLEQMTPDPDDPVSPTPQPERGE